MKKALSFLFPLAALLLIAILAFRWMTNKPAAPQGSISQSAEGIEISDFTDDDLSPQGVEDMESVKLSSPTGEASAQGQIRYAQDEANNKTQFTVAATLPELNADEGFYQLWFEGDKGRKKAMKLVIGKGGFMGEGALTSDFDTVKVLISKEKVDDDTLEELRLEGTLDLNTGKISE